MKSHRVDQGKYLIIIFFVALLLFIPTNTIRAEGQGNLLDCSQIENREERLDCYDEIAHPKSDKAAPTVEQADETPDHSPSNNSYLSRLWELDKDKPRGQYAVMIHRSNYILPVAYNHSPNEQPFEEASTGDEVKATEVKFQISLKIKLWQDILGKDMDLWLGYTQQSFWQLYNFADSSPFRETNYEPEVLLNFRTNFRFLGMTGRTINVGINHQSNGRSEPFSRSWNRIVGNLGLENDNFILLLKTWYRIPQSTEDDDNPDITDYVGYGEVWGYYLWNKQRFGVMLRNNLKSHNNRGALQLEWSIPIFEKVGVYIQYFNGYGESLLDYNHSVNRIGIGFILTDWK
jgi:phospholipase A1